MMHYNSVDEYISAQPEKVQPALKQLRKTIKEVVPKAEEVISYCMPAFKQEGIIVWYAATKKHFALYPKSNAILAFKKELAAYDTAKGTIRFPMDQPLPLSLIKTIVKFRLEEHKEAARLRKEKPSAKTAKKAIVQ